MKNIKHFSAEHISEVARIESMNFNSPWPLEQFESYLLESNESTSYIYQQAENLIGYLMATIVIDEVHLHNISVSQKYQNNKIGFYLMNHLISESRLSLKKKICLEVNENNMFALKLYRNLGFIQVGIREKYYSSREGAILMDCTL